MATKIEFHSQDRGQQVSFLWRDFVLSYPHHLEDVIWHLNAWYALGMHAGINNISPLRAWPDLREWLAGNSRAIKALKSEFFLGLRHGHALRRRTTLLPDA